MASYNEHWHGHLRLTLLRLLSEQQGYKANSSILTDAADRVAGFAATRDQIKTELSWLAEQGLVTNSNAIEGLIVAKITERGIDVAKGLASVPGVQKPAP